MHMLQKLEPGVVSGLAAALSGAAQTPLSRRFVLAAMGGAGIGLVLGLRPEMAHAAPAGADTAGQAFNPFVRIPPDGTVTVIVKHLDKGQGIATGLATLAADEMDADWSKVTTQFAPADAKTYGNALFGGAQGTGGSTSIAASYTVYRNAGAAARAMLVAAAARQWGVDPSTVKVSNGVVSAGSRSAGFGALAEAAAKEQVPAEPKLKEVSAFTLIGKEGVHRVDNAAKTTGARIYTQDLKLPDMLVAVVAHPPRFGATPKSFDATAAKAVKGVKDVVMVPQGVAVLATTTHAAIKGRDALKVDWDESKAETRSTADILADYRGALTKPGLPVEAHGDVEAALKAPGVKLVEAEFEFPYLAHAPMEPMNAAAQVKDGAVTIWTGCQFPSADLPNAARTAGVAPDKVQIHTLWAGGSFGRRALASSDFVVEAVAIAKAHGKGVPVKLVWTREDDMKSGYYRPVYVHKVRAAVDASGKPVAWHHHVVGQSILAGTFFEQVMVKNGVDETSIEGTHGAYDIPNMKVELTTMKAGVPVLWWRSVGHTHTAYAVEVMMDQLARAAEQDPVAFRLAHATDERLKAVIRLAADKAGWGTPLPAGRTRGIAAHKSFNTYVAEVAEISLADSGVKVERVVAAVDCGVVVNPDVVRAQIEGGIGFGLGAALHDAITLDKGAVEQANFDTYAPLRMSEMPKVEVHLVASAAAPTGVGEPGVPPLAPAVANAVLAATGRPVHRLPFAGQAFKPA
ncbi:xanthine dehydrogenase family protein molybdopterin-binding subunit [Xanthobacter sp. DSM 14520]|uniref:xanthine dehydrogenase family protein molybdopterin-binding subunit n=1 Tax=Xanthobacter autotrophicus (strain ATCC BAA-1158 / Py2) TaxID=78245 RepID=UPI00372B63C6